MAINPIVKSHFLAFHPFHQVKPVTTTAVKSEINTTDTVNFSQKARNAENTAPTNDTSSVKP